MRPTSVDPIPPIVAIAGPTAAGKSAFALDLCERLESAGGAEIVSVDSAQVYRGMDIGTAKPDAATRARVPHHLLDLIDPAEAYSAARFATDARAAIEEIRLRGRIPVLIGGTLLYFRALFEGLSLLPPADAGFRARLTQEAAAQGWPALHARLARVDPARAARLHPNDAQRIQRALEIVEFGAAAAAPLPPRLAGTILRVTLAPPTRTALDERIVARLDRMLAAGFIEEVAALRARGDLHLGLPSMRAVGYRQLWRHLEGAYALDEARRLAIIATRQYAKRQMTWLRGEAEKWPEKWMWIDSMEPNAASRVLSLIAEGR